MRADRTYTGHVHASADRAQTPKWKGDKKAQKKAIVSGFISRKEETAIETSVSRGLGNRNTVEMTATLKISH